MSSNLRAVPMSAASLPQGESPTRQRAVLGAIIQNNRHFDAASVLPPDAFRVPHSRDVFRAMQQMHERDQLIDYPGLSDELERQGQLALESQTFLGSLVDGRHEVSPDKVASWVKALADEHTIRVAMREDERIHEALRSGELDPAGAADALEIQAQRLRETSAPNARFSDVSVSGAELVDREIERPRSFVGDGLIVERTLALLYGPPFLGKTWLALQLALAVARGQDWIGFPTTQTHVGILELELPSFYLRQRIKTLAGGRTEGLERLHLISRPELTGAVDLCDPSTVGGLLEWCESHGIELLVMDALSRVHRTDENSAAEFTDVLDSIQRLHDAGVAVLALHHVPKADDETPRGTSRLMSDPVTLLNFVERRGAKRLNANWVNFGPEPGPVYLEQAQQGGFVVIPEPLDPTAVGQGNREKVAAELAKAGPEGATAIELSEALKLSKRTVYRHLEALKAIGDPEGRYTLP